jgi:hypothetical protein
VPLPEGVCVIVVGNQPLPGALLGGGGAGRCVCHTCTPLHLWTPPCVQPAPRQAAGQALSHAARINYRIRAGRAACSPLLFPAFVAMVPAVPHVAWLTRFRQQLPPRVGSSHKQRLCPSSAPVNLTTALLLPFPPPCPLSACLSAFVLPGQNLSLAA